MFLLLRIALINTHTKARHFYNNLHLFLHPHTGEGDTVYGSHWLLYGFRRIGIAVIWLLRCAAD